MSHRHRVAAFGAVLSVTLAVHTTAAGQAGAANDDEPVAEIASCLEHSSVRRTKILNGRNILFTTRAGQSYNNSLPRECPSLKRGSIVNYGIVGGRICAGNTFQVMWQMGLDLVPTFLCQLGTFVPVTEAEVEDLMAVTDETPEGRKKRRKSSREMVTATPIEPAPAETAEQTSARTSPGETSARPAAAE
jgi:hypothetical protein